MFQIVVACSVLLTFLDVSDSFRMIPIKTARFPVCQNVVAIRTDLVDRSLDREHLIAEEMVTDDYSASLLADRFNEFLKVENN